MKRPLSRSLLITATAAFLSATMLTPACADPPPWAPAHGWRKQHDPLYLGYSGKKWGNDFGVYAGRCNREALGAALGGMAGAAVGSQIGEGGGRAAAIILGSVLGAVLGAELGRQMDEEDRACFGHTLELGKRGQTVSWRTPYGVTYAVTPLDEFVRDGRKCRHYETVITRDGRKEKVRGKACAVGEGRWEVID
jgi:surface antigen